MLKLLYTFSLLFTLISAQEQPIEIHLSGDELRDSIEWPSIRDRDTADDMGIFMSDFFDDSKSQVLLFLYWGYTQ